MTFRPYSPFARLKPNEPVVDYAVRTAASGRTVSDAKRQIKRFVRVVGLSLCTWWIFFLIVAAHDFDTAGIVRVTYSSATLLVALLVLGNVVTTLVSSFYNATLSGVSINSEMEHGNWDLLRLTTLPDEKILWSKATAICLMCWPVVITEVALRFGLIVTGVLYLMLPAYYTSSKETFWDKLVNDQSTLAYFLRMCLKEPAWSLYLLTGCASILLVVALEPIWRLRTATMLGMLASPRFDYHSSTLVVSVGLVVFQLISQSVWLLILVSVIQSIVGIDFMTSSAFGSTDLDGGRSLFSITPALALVFCANGILVWLAYAFGRYLLWRATLSVAFRRT